MKKVMSVLFLLLVTVAMVIPVAAQSFTPGVTFSHSEDLRPLPTDGWGRRVHFQVSGFTGPIQLYPSETEVNYTGVNGSGDVSWTYYTPGEKSFRLSDGVNSATVCFTLLNNGQVESVHFCGQPAPAPTQQPTATAVGEDHQATQPSVVSSVGSDCGTDINNARTPRIGTLNPPQTGVWVQVESQVQPSARIRSLPDTTDANNQVAYARANCFLQALAQTAQNEWFLVTANGITGWVSGSIVVVGGSGEIPVVNGGTIVIVQTNTSVPSVTPTATATSSVPVFPQECVGLPHQPGMEIGVEGQVTDTSNNLPTRLRYSPVTGSVIAQMPELHPFVVVGGPSCPPGSIYVWWQISTADNYGRQVTGWAAEGPGGDKDWYIEPVQSR